MQYIKTLMELKREDLLAAGGKGANLGELIQAGLPVPPGFCVTTSAYRLFIETNDLEKVIRQTVSDFQTRADFSADDASTILRTSFRKAVMPDIVADEIRRAYAELSPKNAAVAVRSSATAEDLPDMSFAGQQDTYLNIVGTESVLQHVLECWASLWTARAISYRAHQKLDQQDVFLAVVVQRMVESEASGVLFTANPLTEHRNETVIDAIYGLGEALVSGQVEPDHYIIDSSSGSIISRTLGAKSSIIQSKPGGGTRTRSQSAANRQALPDEQIVELTRLGQQAQQRFGSPQDVEWAWADGKMFIVQSRPITSLFPSVVGLPETPLQVLLSFGVWQGMLDPYTPFGQDIFAILMIGMSSLFGPKIKLEEQKVFYSAAERLFVNLTGLVKNKPGQNALGLFLGAIDRDSESILKEIIESWPSEVNKGVSLKGRLKLMRAIAPLGRNVLYNLMWPARGRARLDRTIASILANVQTSCSAARDLPALIDNVETLGLAIPESIMPLLVGGIASGQAPYQILMRLFARVPGSAEPLMGIARGMPHNVTTQMDLDLWHSAQAIRADAQSLEFFTTHEKDDLTQKFNKGFLPAKAQSILEVFLSKYGMRGIGEIDIGRPRWKDNPANLIQSLKSYLLIAEKDSPEAAFTNGAEKAVQAGEQLLHLLDATFTGRLRKPLVRMLIHRFRELGGLRETPKFFVIKLFGIYRDALLRFGREYADAGKLDSAEDVFFMHLREIQSFAKSDGQDWKTTIAARRSKYTFELERKRIPRILLSDGRAFYHASSKGRMDDPNAISGSPVSAGVVEGTVRVVFNPHDIQLQPGEILVCPATDPAWTPLFLTAGGLVTEVGGMMTHGSVVAREYGIPAVVGVQDATSRLVDGQRVRVDGSNGVITLL